MPLQEHITLEISFTIGIEYDDNPIKHARLCIYRKSERGEWSKVDNWNSTPNGSLVTVKTDITGDLDEYYCAALEDYNGLGVPYVLVRHCGTLTKKKSNYLPDHVIISNGSLKKWFVCNMKEGGIINTPEIADMRIQNIHPAWSGGDLSSVSQHGVTSNGLSGLSRSFSNRTLVKNTQSLSDSARSSHTTSYQQIQQQLVTSPETKVDDKDSLRNVSEERLTTCVPSSPSATNYTTRTPGRLRSDSVSTHKLFDGGDTTQHCQQPYPEPQQPGSCYNLDGLEMVKELSVMKLMRVPITAKPVHFAVCTVTAVSEAVEGDESSTNSRSNNDMLEVLLPPLEPGRMLIICNSYVAWYNLTVRKQLQDAGASSFLRL
jgi:hypothetical protein